MEQAETQTDPAAESDEAQTVAPEESASPTPERTAEINASMNALIRGLGSDSTSKPGAADLDADDDEEPDGVSTSSGDVKPSDAPTPKLGRRAAAAEVARLNGEVTRLSAALDAVTPKVPDATEEARSAVIERENRFRRLVVKPDSDPDWTYEDAQFLAAEKERRAILPEMQQHYDTVLAEDLKARETEFDGRYKGFQDYVLRGMAAVKGLPGIDFDEIQKAPDFIARERLIYAAGAAQHEPELKRLKDENADLRRDLYGATRAPLNGGRSSPGRTYSENDLMNTLIRGGHA